MPQFLLGAVAMASLVAAAFFWRFWRQTHDRFFMLFAAALPEPTAATVQRLVHLYDTHLIAITNLIHSKPSASRVQQFADAFKLRKKD